MCDVHDKRWCLVARRSWRGLWWTEFETTSNWNAGSNQETYWHLCTWAAQVEAQVNLRVTLRQHRNEQTLRILMDVQRQGAHAPRADDEHI